jgi:hypothetical protein
MTAIMFEGVSGEPLGNDPATDLNRLGAQLFLPNLQIITV